MMTTLHGIDLSHWQSGIDVADTDAQFVIVKATDGTNWVDDKAADFYAAAHKAGKLTGVYHFYEGSPTAEADWFVSKVHPVVGKALLVLDFETHTADVDGAKAFLDRVYERTGVRPLIYMSQSVAAGHNWSAVAAHYELWVARYGSAPGDTGAWDNYRMWQYTDAHATAGYKVDGDYFYGTSADWNRLAAGETDSGGGGGGGAKLPEYKNVAWSGDERIAADEVWHDLHIEDGVLTLVHGPADVEGVLSAYVAMPDGTGEFNLRAVHVDHDPDGPDKLVQTSPFTSFHADGGTSQTVLRFTEHLTKPASGYTSRRLRFQIRGWGGGTMTVNRAAARCHYWT